MVKALGAPSMETFIDSVVPPTIRTARPLSIGPPRAEHTLLEELRGIASRNRPWRSLIGMGYHDTITPPVILRNVFENPGWYTAYTPYQAEIAQGRLEALLTYQTMVCDLTGFPLANASLLDEATAAAEAMSMFFASKGRPADGIFLVSDQCHPQTIGVVRTRARPLGIRVEVGDEKTFSFAEPVFGVLLQYPSSDGSIRDSRSLCTAAAGHGVRVAVAADLLALALLTPPGEFGADCAVGSAQRLGVPLGYGGPHAAFMAARDEFRRFLPGRVIGVSVDSAGRRALRMALQTREQHIRREKATSNICTAQVLLAVMAGLYGVYHGPEGLRQIAGRIHNHAAVLAAGARRLGHAVVHETFFDTIRLRLKDAPRVRAAASAASINFRWFDDGTAGIALDEKTDARELVRLFRVLAGGDDPGITPEECARATAGAFPPALARSSVFMTHPVFSSHHSETEMMRYLHLLESRDLALNTSMIPLGSCTMKLNATTEMIPVSWPEFTNVHPFAPQQQAEGYAEVLRQLSTWLSDITGLDKLSFQPNAGAQGEYTGLLVIRAFHESRGETRRRVCLIPSSAHGTNPASAVMAGFEVVIVRCDERGNIDVADLRIKAEQHRERLAALMVTYPSTHGVFEEAIKDMCAIIHSHGGQVYMDGANMNALVGLCRPAELGADVCHINLHKTFCIPHGGGGPGMGPIAVAPHLAPFLPGHPVIPSGGEQAIGPVSAAPWGSANILLISWMYMALMGGDGLRRATQTAILNANYMAALLASHYPVLYTGKSGRVAHEFIIDLRGFKESAGIEAEDIAKRLMDYGFHAPTVSFPVAGTLMIEPTESEPRGELDRFCEALIAIREEIREIETGAADRRDNVLKNAPHTAAAAAADRWPHPYGREKAVFPAPWTRAHKFWPPVGRINNAFGDRNLVCTCPPSGWYEEVAPAPPV
jgi:glycine dehydrogenase